MKAVYTILLLIVSNVFMTLVWSFETTRNESYI